MIKNNLFSTMTNNFQKSNFLKSSKNLGRPNKNSLDKNMIKNSTIFQRSKRLSQKDWKKNTLKLKKINPASNRNQLINKARGEFTLEKLPKNRLLSMEEYNNRVYKTMNNLNDEESEISSMETIKNILIDTEKNQDIKEDLSKSNKSKDDFDTFKTYTQNNFKKKLNQKPSKKVIDKYGVKLSNYISINKIHENLSAKNKEELKRLRFFKLNDYDYDNNENLYNSDEFKNVLGDNKIINSLYNKNNNYMFRKINNNYNINISNHNKDLNNIYYNNNYKYKNDETEYKLYLKEKINKLKEEINKKNLLINEYLSLIKNSKVKFEQLIEYNNAKIEEIKKESKMNIILLRTKLYNMEKEKNDLYKKYIKDKEYINLIQNLLYEKLNQNNLLNEKLNTQNLKSLIKKLLGDISELKLELNAKNEENEKLRNILIQNDNKTYRNINSKNISNNIDQVKIKKRSNNENNQRLSHLNTSVKTKYNIRKFFMFN